MSRHNDRRPGESDPAGLATRGFEQPRLSVKLQSFHETKSGFQNPDRIPQCQTKAQSGLAVRKNISAVTQQTVALNQDPGPECLRFGQIVQDPPMAVLISGQVLPESRFAIVSPEACIP
jgi:hypothetical protein